MHALGGQAFHAACREHLQGQSVAKSMAAFDTIYKDWAQLHVSVEDRMNWANVSAITKRFMEAHAVEGQAVKEWPFTIERVEIPFEILLTKVDGVEVLFVGRIDVLAKYLGYYVIVDHKTTGFLNDQWRQQWSMDGQMTGYCWAASQLFGPVIGAFINGVQFSKLPDSDKRCSDHGMKYRECKLAHAKWELVGLLERNAAMIENWHADAVSMATTLYKMASTIGDDLDTYIEGLAQEGVWTGECRWCEFRKPACEIGRAPGVVRAALEFAPWNPLEG